MFGKFWRANEDLSRRLNRMNATLIRPEGPKLLAASEDSAVGNSKSEHRHSSRLEHFYSIEEIHIRAEAVTPLLREILDFHPAPHWGINE